MPEMTTYLLSEYCNISSQLGGVEQIATNAHHVHDNLKAPMAVHWL